jgi:hypothetical protein
MEPTWPTTVTSAKITSFTKTDRNDGYDFKMSIHYDRANGVPEIWNAAGSLFKRTWGTEWIVDFTVQGVAPGQTPAMVPKKIETKIFDTEEIEGDLQGATVEITTTYLDGHKTTSKKPSLILKDTVNPTADEYLEGLRNFFGGSGFNGIFSGQSAL